MEHLLCARHGALILTVTTVISYVVMATILEATQYNAHFTEEEI